MRITTLFRLCLALCFSVAAYADDNTPPSAQTLNQQLSAVKNDENTPDAKQLIPNLEGALAFLEQADKQQTEISKLEQEISNVPTEMKLAQENIEQLKKEVDLDQINQYTDLSIADLEEKQTDLQQQLHELQSDTGDFGYAGTSFSYSTLLERVHQSLSTNSQRVQKIINLRYSSQASSSLKDKYNAELYYLDLNSRFYNLVRQNSDALQSLNELKQEERHLKQQLLQKQVLAVQEVLNHLRLQEYEAQAQQTEDLKQNSKAMNEGIQNELNINTRLSQFLIEQTQNINVLSQDSLHVGNVLESLTQTQRSIEEQISTLQGTLVLSRVITQQQQSLPSGEIIKGMGQTIADTRVNIFEYTQRRDQINSIDSYIDSLAAQHAVTFTDSERDVLTTALQERKRLLNDIIKSLNSQLNLSITIEANQQQAITISNSLRNTLQQQSFWVKSNTPLDLTWVENFPRMAWFEISALIQHLHLIKFDENLAPTLIFILFLFLPYGAIIWAKKRIKARLTVIAGQVNTLKNDSQWHTPEALIWTVVLALPSSLLFLAASTLVTYLLFQSPVEGFSWATQLSLVWWFFATVLALLRPNGLAYRHFGMPKESNELFQGTIKKSIVIIALTIAASTFSNLEPIGYSNDVIGQVMTLVSLILCFVALVVFNKAIDKYGDTLTETGETRSTRLLKFIRFVLFVAPSVLGVLVVIGYYYTAVQIIWHLLGSYVVVIVWVFGRQMVFRFLSISSRRMAYRRLQEKRQKIKRERALFEQHGAEVGEKRNDEAPEDIIKISTVNQQLTQVAGFVTWVILAAMLYFVWSDLISVAYYLDGFILWESIEATSSGNSLESITLLNLVRAFLVLGVTYLLVRNISGILEVAVFSRLKTSRGTPHTTVALARYLIIAIGSIWSFSNLGISWNKIQWLFTALSVGLGFGVREIFGSFVSGVILLFDRPIRVGDKVTVGQFTGTVSKITLRSTTLLDSDNKDVVLPNQAFVTDRFINWTLNNSVTRIIIPVTVASDSDLDVVHKLLFQAAEEAPKVVQNPEVKVNFLHFGKNGLEYELQVHVADLDDRVPTTNFLNYRINQLFKQHQIGIAFEQLDVNLRQAERAESTPIQLALTQTLVK